MKNFDKFTGFSTRWYCPDCPDGFDPNPTLFLGEEELGCICPTCGEELCLMEYEGVEEDV